MVTIICQPTLSYFPFHSPMNDCHFFDCGSRHWLIFSWLASQLGNTLIKQLSVLIHWFLVHLVCTVIKNGGMLYPLMQNHSITQSQDLDHHHLFGVYSFTKIKRKTNLILDVAFVWNHFVSSALTISTLLDPLKPLFEILNMHRSLMTHARPLEPHNNKADSLQISWGGWFGHLVADSFRHTINGLSTAS
jgi:hypothetical protein